MAISGIKGRFFKDRKVNRDAPPPPVVKTFKHPPKFTIKCEAAKRTGK